MTSKKNRIHPVPQRSPSGGIPSRQLIQGSCVCCRSYKTLSSVFHPVTVDGKVNGLPLLLPKIQKDDQQLAMSADSGEGEEREGSANRKNKGKEPEHHKEKEAQALTVQPKKISKSHSTEQLCFRHYYLNHHVNTAPYQLRDGSCMCCYTHKTNSADFYTVTNGIVDKFLCPLLLPPTTTHGTGVICTKHFVRNMELYEIYKKSHDIQLECGAFMQPKNDKGEDAYFIGETGKYVGLADGVGGWAQYNIDPRQFPEKLMEEVHAVLREGTTCDVQEVLNNAFENAKHVTGSSTVVIALLDKNDTLRTLNLGDSGFRVIRDHQILYATKEQQHAPNKPFQLGTSCEDTSESAVVEHMKLRAGDTIIFGSDGLFDNLFDEQIVDLLKNTVHTDLSKIAHEVAMAAYKISVDKSAFSPYAAWVRSLGNPEWSEVLGGKKDDITVMVARVEQHRAPSHDLSFTHYQSTAMSFSIDSQYLQDLFSRVKWDSPDSALRSLTDADAQNARTRITRERMLFLSEGIPRRPEEDRETLRPLSQTQDIPREGKEMRRPPIGISNSRSRRSLSDNGYFPAEDPAPQSGSLPNRERGLIELALRRNSSTNSMRRGSSSRSNSVRELLSQPTEQPSADVDPRTLPPPSPPLHSQSAPPSALPSPHEKKTFQRTFTSPSMGPRSQTVPGPSPSPSPSPPLPPHSFLNTSTSVPSPLDSHARRPPLPASAHTAPSPTYLHTSPSPTHLHPSTNSPPRDLAQLRRIFGDSKSSSGASSTAASSRVSPSKSGGELVAAKPTWKPTGTEQDYFEYMVAMREFEVFVNLHRNTRITILPYFI